MAEGRRRQAVSPVVSVVRSRDGAPLSPDACRAASSCASSDAGDCSRPRAVRAGPGRERLLASAAGRRRLGARRLGGRACWGVLRRRRSWAPVLRRGQPGPGRGRRPEAVGVVRRRGPGGRAGAAPRSSARPTRCSACGRCSSRSGARPRDVRDDQPLMAIDGAAGRRARPAGAAWADLARLRRAPARLRRPCSTEEVGVLARRRRRRRALPRAGSPSLIRQGRSLRP